MPRRRGFGKNTYKGRRGGRGGRNKWGRGGQYYHNRNKNKKKNRPKSIMGTSLNRPSRPTRMEQKIKALGAKKIQLREGDWKCPLCTIWNFGKRTSCFKCGENRPEQEVDSNSKSKFDDVSLTDIFNFDTIMILVTYLNITLIARLSCVCRELRDVMVDTRIWTELMYRHLSATFYKTRLETLTMSSRRKPYDYTAFRPPELRVNLIVRNMTNIVYEVWYINMYSESKKLQILLPNAEQVIKTAPNICFVFIPVEDYFLMNREGSNMGVAMRVMLSRVSDVRMKNNKITGIEWIIRPRAPQPIKGMDKSYTREQYTQIMLRHMNLTAKVFKIREKKAIEELGKLKKELEEEMMSVQRLKNLCDSARADVEAASYGVKMLTKK